MTKKICPGCDTVFISNESEVCGYCLNPLEAKVKDLKSYLLSEKFHKDTTVQVNDVLRRLE